jgi:hypothetical protein
MECVERERLWEEYQRLVTDYAVSTDKLVRPSGPEFAGDMKDAQKAKLLCQAAWQKWQDHIREHECTGYA